MTTARAASPAPPMAWRHAGFTLLELLVVVALIAIASAGVSFALRDSQATQLEREAQRLAALLESARAQSRASGTPVRWRPVQDGFRFEGLAEDTLPGQWLSTDVRVNGNPVLTLGPEPVIGRQSLRLVSPSDTTRSLVVGTDGVRPFAIAPPAEPAP